MDKEDKLEGMPVFIDVLDLKGKNDSLDYNDYESAAKPACLKTAKNYRDETCFRKWEEGKWKQFGIWETSIETLGQFGSGIELYFRLLRNLGYTFFVIACLSIYPIYINSQQDGLNAGDIRQRWDTWAVSNLDKVTNDSDGTDNDSAKFKLFVIDAIYSCIFICSIIYIFITSNSSVKRNFERNVTLADYSIEVKGLPELETSPESVKTHFEQFGKVHEVYLARKYDGVLYLYKERAQLSNQLAYLNLVKLNHKLNPKKTETLKEKISKFDQRISNKQLKSAKPHDDLPVIRGFVVFADFTSRKLCLDAYSKAKSCCASRSSQPRQLKYLERHPLSISQTAAPSNIIYENLEINHCSRFLRQILSIFCVLLALLASVSMIYALKLYQDDLPSSSRCKSVQENLSLSEASSIYTSDTDKYCYCKQQSLADVLNDSDLFSYCDYFFERISKAVAIRVSVSFGVVLINFIIKFIFRIIGKYEKVHNRSTEQLKLMSKVFIATFINTALVVLAVNANFSDLRTESWMPEFLFNAKFKDFSRQWYVQVGSTLVSTMMISIFSPHVFLLFTFYPIGVCRRRCCPRRYVSQAEANLKFSGAEFELATRNSLVLSIVFTCFLYSGGMPIMNIICFLSLFTLYWTDKFLILRHYKRPPLINHFLNQRVLHYLPYSIILHCSVSLYMYGATDIFPYHVDSNGIIKSNSILDRIKSLSGLVFILIGIVAAALAVWIFFHAKIFACLMKKRLVRVVDENVTERKLEKEMSNIRSHGLETYDIKKHPDYRDIIKALNAGAKTQVSAMSLTNINNQKE